jgi:hypothetical protein
MLVLLGCANKCKQEGKKSDTVKSKKSGNKLEQLHESAETNVSTARMRKQMQTRRKEKRYCQKQEVS